ncbi:hypothetical protein Hanom_Chr02g00110161 [Helianthus anomalus]
MIKINPSKSNLFETYDQVCQVVKKEIGESPKEYQVLHLHKFMLLVLKWAKKLLSRF